MTQDTKQEEARFIRDLLEKAGCSVIHLDASVRRSVGGAEISPEEIALAGGMTIDQVRALGHEGKCLEAMIRGAVPLVLALNQKSGLSGVLGVGGSLGTTLGTAIMRALPYGLPKLMVSTMASGFTAAFVGVKDIAMLNAVTDVSGLNSIARDVYRNAALGMAGMAKGYAQRATGSATSRPLVLMGALGTLESLTRKVREALEAVGCEVMVFHTSGAGGLTLDTIAKERDVALVLDLSLSEVVNRMNGALGAGQEDRARAAVERGIPTLFAPGNIDFLFGPPFAEAQRRWPDRRLHQHNPALTAVRTSLGEMTEVADYVSALARDATGPVSIFVPLQGLSHHDSPEGHLHDPGLAVQLAAHLSKTAPANMPVHTVDAHINDSRFAAAIVAQAKRYLGIHSAHD